MPTFMSEQVARSLYKLPRNNKSPLTYSRAYFDTAGHATQLWRRRADALSIPSGSAVLVVGSGFGYLMEVLTNDGVEVWGMEPGTWFWMPSNDSEWADSMKSRTTEDWVGSGTERQSLNALGVTGAAKFDYVIDEDACPAHGDGELDTFISGLEDRLKGNQKSNILHIVTPVAEWGPGDSSQNWKTLEEWQSVASDHTWIDARSVH